MKLTRRQTIACLASIAGFPIFAQMARTQSLLKRVIPSTGESIPAIGVGTWQTFDVGTSATDRAPLLDVLRKMIELGATVIDSSPMYGNSEGVVGDLSTQANVNDKLFVATKVWTTGEQAGIDQMNRSFNLLKREKMDLMQIHNLVDWQTHLKTLRRWKEQGKIRYIGITHYTDGAHTTLTKILKEHPIDFVQANYNLLDTNAELELLPVAQERKVAVIANRPFEEGSLFRMAKGKEVPAWAKEFGCESWAQFFLKFILSHPSVTVAIPGTSKVAHLLDNLGATQGRLPDAREREKMKSVFKS